jgi:hypothetical protein
MKCKFSDVRKEWSLIKFFCFIGMPAEDMLKEFSVFYSHIFKLNIVSCSLR